MEIKPAGKNVTTLSTREFKFLVSYQTTVGCQNKTSGEVFITSKKWSATTSRHIASWLRDLGLHDVDCSKMGTKCVCKLNVKEVEQEVLDKML